MEFPLLLADQLGLHLKSLRKLRGWSQADLGRRLGVGQARVAAIEAKPGSISVDQLLRIFQVLEVELVARMDTPATPATATPDLPSDAPALIGPSLVADMPEPPVMTPTPGGLPASASPLAALPGLNRNQGLW